MSNTGHYNTGHYNTGDRNSGYRNSGHYNSGNYNSGNRNSGHYNSGDRNSGYWNSGNHNSGHYNSGNWNSGFFCTETPKPTFFDKPVDLTWEEACSLVPNIELDLTDKSYKEAFVDAWSKSDENTKQRFLNLPNFNADKFFQITGVDVRENNAETEHESRTICIGSKKVKVSENRYKALMMEFFGEEE